MTPKTPAPRRPEPGAKHDHLAHFGFGPGVTPVDDLSTAAICIAGVVGTAIFASLPEMQGWGSWLIWSFSLMMAGGAAYTAQRGIRRWRWRRANVDLTGGVYVRPWEKTPSARTR